MINLVVGIACIAFFGYGAILLLRQRNLLYSLGCLIFIGIGIFMIFSGPVTDNNENDVVASTPVSKSPTENTVKETQAVAESVKLINNPLHDKESQILLDVIQNVVDSDFTFNTSIKQIELNEHMGTTPDDDFIALISLSYEALHSEETTKKWIEEYTSHLAAKISEVSLNINELVIFWETPRFKENWNTAKFKLIKVDNVFYFESETFDKTVFN